MLHAICPYSDTWLMLPEVAHALHSVFPLADRFGRGEIAAGMGHARPDSLNGRNAVRSIDCAHLTLSGPLFQHSSFLQQWVGGTALSEFDRQLMQARSLGVQSIVVEVNSPGGELFGQVELANRIFALRTNGVRIIAHINSTATAGAYMIASAATEVHITSGGITGGLGAVSFHRDHSGQLTQEGTKITLIASPKRKVDGNPFEPLSATARSAAERKTENEYRRMLRLIARHRGTSPAKVARDFGAGAQLNAEEALAAGLVDSIGPITELFESELRRARRARERQRR